MVGVHRDKAFRALNIMACRGTVRKAQRVTRLGFTQLKELREVLPVYIEVKDLERVSSS